MAHVQIISSQTSGTLFDGAPRYVGAYLKPGYLEFSAVGSPTAIPWHVGDYAVYPKTGKTYRLYRTPQMVEQGESNRYGGSFLYENVQLFDDSKRLEFCPFTDLVPGDNTVHFSTQNVVSFFGKPLNVAERLQACLEAQYGSGSWEVRIVTTTDADLLELLDTEVEFSVSGVSCLGALDKTYELWNGLGWIHTVENGVNVITIGASNVRTNANTTAPFAYGNGLVRVERSIANADEIGTRLFAYGSMKNMDATYYRGLNIYHAESVDIEHLMIPLANWGLTDNKPDARKAFIEDAAAIARLGLIPKTAYFDGTGDLPDIHPTLERMTIGEVYDAGGAGYIPDLSKWSRNQRVDEVVSATNPTDHGTSAEQGQRYTEAITGTLASYSDTFGDNDYISWPIFSVTTTKSGKLTLRFGQNAQGIALASAWTPTFTLWLKVYCAGIVKASVGITPVQTSGTAWRITLPESITAQNVDAGLVEVKVEGMVHKAAIDPDTVSGTFTTDSTTSVEGGVEYELDKTFTIRIPQIGFDIDKYADLGDGKTISFKTGMCAGRDFKIKGVSYQSSTDSWVLTLWRSTDEDLGIMFPNADYEIAAGDQFVLLDIAMPDMYVAVASNRLLAAAQKLLSDISVERPFYAPQIDAKVVYNESRVLLEGMWMHIRPATGGAAILEASDPALLQDYNLLFLASADSDREDAYILIDSITIDENGSNIPTYEVTLRERKGLDWTENVGKTTSGKSSVSVSGQGDEPQSTVNGVSLEQGISNGSLRLVVNGTPGQDVIVKGLGSFAYKNSLAVSDIPDLSSVYLPLTGGTLTGDLGILKNHASLTLRTGDSGDLVYYYFQVQSHYAYWDTVDFYGGNYGGNFLRVGGTNLASFYPGGSGKVGINASLQTINGQSAALYVDGAIHSTGDQVLNSDATLKKNLQDLKYTVEDIAKAPAVSFDWKDKEGHSFGSIAQYWKPICPEMVHGVEGQYSLAYAQGAFTNTILLARRIVELEKQIKELKDKYGIE